MKKLHLFKTVLLLCALVVGSGNLWADTYTRITSTSDLEAGCDYLIVGLKTSNTTYYSLGTWTAGKSGKDYYAQNPITVSDNQCTNVGSAHVVTLGGSTGEWTLYDKTDKKYLALTSDANGIHQASEVSNNTAKWSITFSSNKVSITNVDKTTRTLYYNTSATRFACYTSAQNGGEMYLYKKDGKTDPDITFNNGTMRVGQSFDLSTLFSSDSKGAVNYTVTNAGDTGATIAGSIMTASATGTATVKASQEATATMNAGEATATITVNAALELSSIKITAAPTKTSYTEDECFDKTGMVVTATYSDASTADVTEYCEFTPSLTTPLTSANTSIEVSYTENAVTKTANQAISVVDKPRYTITWMVNGSQVTSDSYKQGVSLSEEFPDVDAIGGKVFMGWVTTSTVANPYTGEYVNTASATATAATTYYAVFATKTGNIDTKTDNLDCAFTGVTSNSYSSWSDMSDQSDAVYAGVSATNNTQDYIQLRSNKSDSGIITTTSGGNAKKVTVTWNNTTEKGRTLDIYGKATAYEAVGDLYNNSNQGTKIGSIVCGTSTELTIDADYEYIAMRSNSGAMYIDNIAIEWEKGSITYSDYCTTISSVSGTISDAGWSTFSSDLALDFTDVEGLEAYMITGHDGVNIVKSQVKGTVPANTGLLLKGAEGNYVIPVVGSSSTDVSANKMVAGTGASVSAEANKTKYVLGKNGSTGKAEFQKIVSTSATVPAGKAYLQFNEEINARVLQFDEGETTAISEVRGLKSDVRGEFYNLNGQRVAQPSKGLYIVNGKKVMFK